MSFKRPKARILELTATSGNGPYTLAGAADGSYNRFSAFMSVGDTTHITVVEPGIAFWTGIGTYSAANQITLTTVEESKGTFGTGTKEVMAGHLAAHGVAVDDMMGSIVTGGTSTAYTVASFRVYDSLTRLHNQVIAFTPHTANGATVTLAVDGLTAKPLRLTTGIELQSNVLVAGTPYMALYNNTDGAFYLHMLASNPFGIPIGAGIEYWGTNLPSSAYVRPTGQALDRTIYAKLFAETSTRYGSGNGTTTFNIQDKQGFVSAMKEASASRLTSSFFGGDSTLPGSIGGSEKHQLTTAQIASHTHTGTTGTESATHTHGYFQGSAGPQKPNSAGTTPFDSSGTGATTTTESAAHTHSFTSDATGGGGFHNNTQPTMICDYIMRVI